MAKTVDQRWREMVTERLTRIEAGLVSRDDIVAMRQSFADFQHYLGGNGSPGLCQRRGEEIASLAERTEKALEKMQGRIGDLEKRQSWIFGLGAGISAMFSSGAVIVSRLLGK
jgi:hypothetical protein